MPNEPQTSPNLHSDPMPSFRPLAALPIAAFAVVHLLQVEIYALLDLGREISDLPSPGPATVSIELADLARRLEHSLSGFALALAWATLVGLTAHTLWSCLQNRRLRLTYATAGGGLAVGLFAWSLAVNPLTLPALRPTLDAYFRHRNLNGSLLIHLPNALIIAGAVLLAVAVSALLVPGLSTGSARQLRSYQRRLRLLLYTAAATLVAGVVHVRTLHHLPTSFLGEGSAAIATAANGLALSTGSLWTLLLLTIYLPAALALNENGYALGRAAGAGEGGDLKTWLQTQGLDSTPLQHLLRLGATLAPFVAGSQALEVLQLFGS